MERTTFNLLFYIRRTKLNKTGEAPVFMRLTIDGSRAEASVKHTIKPNNWSTAKGRAENTSKEGKSLNVCLDAITTNIMRIRRELEFEGVELTAHTVMDRYLGRDKPERHTLLEIFNEHNEKYRRLSGIDIAPGTVQRHLTCYRLTEEFIKKNYNKDDIYLDELSEQFVEDYEFYMKTERHCCHNTTTKYLKNLKQITRIALSKGYLKKDPFANIKFHFDRVDKDFLEKHELKRLKEKQITIPRIAQVRDIFCFCCLTGLAFSDIKQLKREHIVTDMNGMQWIRKARQKTSNMCNIPLMSAAREIMDLYKEHPYCRTHDVLFPVLSNQKMNAYLKEVADICGITKHLSMHTARHTFATLTLAGGATIDNVAKMLGHSDTNMTRHYARILDSSIMRDMQIVEKSMAL